MPLPIWSRPLSYYATLASLLYATLYSLQKIFLSGELPTHISNQNLNVSPSPKMFHNPVSNFCLLTWTLPKLLIPFHTLLFAFWKGSTDALHPLKSSTEHNTLLDRGSFSFENLHHYFLNSAKFFKYTTYSKASCFLWLFYTLPLYCWNTSLIS